LHDRSTQRTTTRSQSHSNNGYRHAPTPEYNDSPAAPVPQCERPDTTVRTISVWQLVPQLVVDCVPSAVTPWGRSWLRYCPSSRFWAATGSVRSRLRPRSSRGSPERYRTIYSTATGRGDTTTLQTGSESCCP